MVEIAERVPALSEEGEARLQRAMGMRFQPSLERRAELLDKRDRLLGVVQASWA